VLRAEVPGASTSDKVLVASWAERLLALVLPLIPPAAAEKAEGPSEGKTEGDMWKAEVKKYERNAINRANCLAAHGDACLACGTNFGRTYGSIGEGFIHVHHVVPVSKLGPGYMIDPVDDLIPLCPNCHAMAHRSDPPFRVEQLRAFLAGALSPDLEPALPNS
jgi:5-methylcytosine-specific restriction protein A